MHQIAHFFKKIPGCMHATVPPLIDYGFRRSLHSAKRYEKITKFLSPNQILHTPMVIEKKQFIKE